MSDPVSALFELELARRGVKYRFDTELQRYRVEHQGGALVVSLDNLARAYSRDHNESRVAWFVDSVLGIGFENRSWQDVQLSVLFALEPSDYAEPPNLRTAVSKRVDRVPVHVSDEAGNSITWITRAMLDDWNISLAELEATASRNLATALAAAKLAYEDIDGVRLGFLETELPFKAALILAPNLREIVSPTVGWPLHAVIPDRDFLYLWAPQHSAFINKVGRVVVKVFTSAPYPITTEVFEIGDGGIKAIGAFPTP